MFSPIATLLSDALPTIDWNVNQYWYLLPLIVVVSLAYAATRHEEMGPILHHALRIGVMIVVFIAIATAIFQAGLWAASG